MFIFIDICNYFLMLLELEKGFKYLVVIVEI